MISLAAGAVLVPVLAGVLLRWLFQPISKQAIERTQQQIDEDFAIRDFIERSDREYNEKLHAAILGIE